MTRLRRNSLLGLAATVFAVLVLLAMRGGELVPGAERIVGIWRYSSVSGYRVAFRMSADGSCELASYKTDSGQYERSKNWRWQFENGAILVYHYNGRHAWVGDWSDDLRYAVAGPDERLRVLVLNDTELTIEGYQGPLTYQRVESDPAFATVAP